MKLLLDSHSLIWYAVNSPSLSPRAKQAITDPDNEAWVSIATFWELAIKQSIGKLEIADLAALRTRVESEDIQVMGIELRHTELVAALPLHHRDPFDRMLVAQSLAEELTIVSADTALDAYGIGRLW